MGQKNFFLFVVINDNTLAGALFKLLYIFMSVTAYLSTGHGRVDEDDFVGSFILKWPQRSLTSY